MDVEVVMGVHWDGKLAMMNFQIRTPVVALCFALIAAGSPGHAQSNVRCAIDQDAMLAMDVAAFDQSDTGWRLFGEEGCEQEAADLIAAYVRRHGAALSEAERRQLSWHEGQLRAALGEYTRAAELFAASRPSEPEGDRQLYVDASVAFVLRDRAALEAARDQMRLLPAPRGWDEAADRYQARFGRTIEWPPNLALVESLLACFDRPYSEAYSLTCRPE